MKRMYYVSRFGRSLSKRELADLHETSLRNNRRAGVTGFLVCLGDTFFQVLEGPTDSVDRLYYERILPDPRHKDVFCLKAESGVKERIFPDWNMRVFNLNEHAEALPFAFRQMLTALLESSHTISQYTQPTVFRMLEHGLSPTQVPPRRIRVTVLYSDIVGFSYFAERLKPRDMIELVNSHVEVCTRAVSAHGGEVNKLTGDGVLAYFPGGATDEAIQSALDLLKEMRHRRSCARRSSPHQLLYGCVGLSNGVVYEGNVGHATKRDFTILGNAVNTASRLESLTRDLGVRLTLDPSVVRRAERRWPFASLGKHQLKGQSRAVEISTLRSLPKLDIAEVYEQIRMFVRKSRARRSF